MNSKDTAEIVKALIGPEILQRLRKRYGIDVFNTEDGAIIRIPLLKGKKKVDNIDLPILPSGLVHPGQALHNILVAWEIGLRNSEWNESLRRLRRTRF